MADEIARISKRFLDDQDDGWVLYLSSTERQQLRDKRLGYHNLLEELEELKQSYRDTKDDATKKQMQECKQKLNSFVKALVPKLRNWKDVGTTRGIEEANNNPIFNSSKRRRVDTADSQSESRPQPTTQLYAQEQATRSLLKGVELESDRKVLKELRTLIVRYDCRDRVLKALESVNKRDTGLTGLKSFTSLLNMK